MIKEVQNEIKIEERCENIYRVSVIVNEIDGYKMNVHYSVKDL